MSEGFVDRQTISLSQVDGAGILYFSRIFEICHLAFERFLAAHEGARLTAESMQRHDWLLPVVHAEADYRSPLRLGDPVSIEVHVESRGQSSVTFGFRVTGPGGLAAAVRHVHVAIDKASFRSRPLPDDIVQLGNPGDDA